MTSASRSKGDDVAAVAAGLTEAQAKALLAASGARLGTLSPAAMHSRQPTCEALVRKSLFWRGSNRWTGQPTYGPTNTGLAVRAHLTDQEGQNR